MASNKRGRKRNTLGLWTVVALAALLGSYVGVLNFTRPHVEGDRLRLDTFVNLVVNGRIKNAQVLDEDAYVVGTYVKVPKGYVEAKSNESAQLGNTGGGHSGHGGLTAGASAAPTTAPPAPEPPGSTRRRFAAPLLKSNANSSGVVDLLVMFGVPTTINQQVSKRLANVTTMILPALMMVVIFLYLIVSYVKGTGLFNVRSGAKKVAAGETNATFADVAGQEAAVLELKEVRDFLANPQKFKDLGAIIPKGILLFGPPGCGKTLLARAVAGEAGAAFFSISGADFVELYVGVGASRVRDLFAEARENAPAIVFIDEIDAVGRRRRGGGAGASGSHEEQEQALNQILTELDGFSPLDGIIVIGATNRPDILDPALLRPGRFDRTIGLERPDESGRLEILRVHATGKPLDNVDLSEIANRAVGLSGADLASVMNEGALLAARAGRAVITQDDLKVSLQRVLEAPARQKRLSMRDRSFSRATGGDDKVTFDDVAGVDEAIEELSEVREYLVDPERFVHMGAKPPQGFLLAGPPGCGKTMLAKAVAVEANATFFSVAATEFVEVFVGEGAARVRDLFAEAKAGAPSVVFIDEIDAIGARRGVSVDGNREREQTLNQILIELDGFDARSGVTVLAATNRMEILDEALVRPGRFDRTIVINLPDRAARRSIIDVHARGKRLGPDVDLDELSSMTQGYSGADLANVMNEAALLAARHRLEAVPMNLVVEAVERVGLGVARAQRLTEQDRQMVAYHEVGHALVGRALPGGNRPRRISIVARGHSLGATWNHEQGDRVVFPRSVLIDRMAGLLGGRAAEELVFGEPGSGASDDLKRVAEMARQMVCDFAMSDAIGPVAYPGASVERTADPAAAQAIDTEVRKLIDEAYGRARAVLVASREAMDRAARALITAESLTGDELDELAGPVPKLKPAATASRL